ncbi:MAG: hypothetical protein U0V74_11170 [Chitinophagales bacterium]
MKKQFDIRCAEVFINEVVFYSRTQVSLFGFIYKQDTFHETEFRIGRQALQNLLSQNGQLGVELLWTIERLFTYPHAMPARINIVDAYGTTQALKASAIHIDLPWYENEQGELKPSPTYSLLFIEEVLAPEERGSTFSKILKTVRNA